jgi:hypothetical protein
MGTDKPELKETDNSNDNDVAARATQRIHDELPSLQMGIAAVSKGATVLPGLELTNKADNGEQTRPQETPRGNDEPLRPIEGQSSGDENQPLRDYFRRLLEETAPVTKPSKPDKPATADKPEGKTTGKPEEKNKPVEEKPSRPVSIHKVPGGTIVFDRYHGDLAQEEVIDPDFGKDELKGEVITVPPTIEGEEIKVKPRKVEDDSAGDGRKPVSAERTGYPDDESVDKFDEKLYQNVDSDAEKPETPANKKADQTTKKQADSNSDDKDAEEVQKETAKRDAERRERERESFRNFREKLNPLHAAEMNVENFVFRKAMSGMTDKEMQQELNKMAEKFGRLPAENSQKLLKQLNEWLGDLGSKISFKIIPAKGDIPSKLHMIVDGDEKKFPPVKMGEGVLPVRPKLEKEPLPSDRMQNDLDRLVERLEQLQQEKEKKK